MSENEVSRRALLQSIGASLALGMSGAGLLSAQDAAHVHHAVAEDRAKGDYQPKCFTPHEYATLRRLAELIVPPDEHSKGALDAGAPEFIDLLASHNSELAAIYTGGMGWLDEQMKHRYAAAFLDAQPAQQMAMLDMRSWGPASASSSGCGTWWWMHTTRARWGWTIWVSWGIPRYRNSACRKRPSSMR
jgi:hypothetical protein